MINMNKRWFEPLVIALFATVILIPYCLASNAADEAVAVKTAWSANLARPGDSILLAIVADISKGFHINADERQIKSFEDFKPIATKVSVIEAPDAITIEAPRYPQAVPFKAQYAAGDLMSYEGQIIIYLPIKLEETAAPGSLDLKLRFQYQACTDTYCLFPKRITLTETLAVVKIGTNVSEINQELFSAYGAAATVPSSAGVDFDLFGWTFSIDTSSGLGLVLLLLTAVFGGMLLNFTPCVLPLIPIKIISLSHVAQNRKQCFMLGLAMFLGVLVFWLALGVMIALVSGFSATNQLFQYPAFTIIVGIIIGIMATGMFGFFSMRLPNFIYMINPEQDTLHGSFGLGILAAILSTPCTAPFMGAAAAWAATRPPSTTLATFAAIGIGMALPYLVLSASPALVEKMPKTGPASVLIKEVMGFFMLAAAAYFIGVGLAAIMSSPPNPPNKLYWWPVMLFSFASGAWLTYRTLQIATGKKIRAFFTALGIIVIAFSAWGAVRLTDQGPIDWVYYTEKRFEAATNERKVIVMVFTAEWCLNCKVIEQGVLNSPRIVALFERDDIVPMKVDITGNNSAGKAKLRKVGNLTIPLLVIFSPNGKQVFKNDFYTVGQIQNAVTEALQIRP
ncbi:Cytochrome c-type biogenesis protein DsbD, protein-disulfide reductase (EC [Olavius sp. associated proteobacterium Delta 1]|nr:Cytochrome c-type biogenesis protein DsbD, protein-disulfide reductase (EC [Olavius sp. associated proteobacterium Delta 1]